MYTYDVRIVDVVYTPVGVVAEWLWNVHSKLECTLRQGKSLIPAWTDYYIHHKVWDEIIYPFPNVNGDTVEVWE